MLAEYPVIARNLTWKAGFKTIIEDVSLVLKKNEFVGLIGGSGSGKTTLLTCLNGYREPDGGQVIVNEAGDGGRDRLRSLVGYVPQDDIVHRTLTVERALTYAAQLRLPADTPDDRIEYQVGKVMYWLDLRDHRDKKIKSLSGGQRKRVSIGVELLHSPPLFYLDEPTAGLDPSLERQLMRLLAGLAKKDRMILMTTHLMQNVTLFDVLIFVHRGRMIYCGPSTEITAYFGAGDMVEVFERVAPKDAASLSNAFRQSPVYMEFMAPRIQATAHVR